MGEIDYIVDNELIKEKSLLKEDLYTDHCLEILMLLLKGERTADGIAKYKRSLLIKQWIKAGSLWIKSITRG